MSRKCNSGFDGGRQWLVCVREKHIFPVRSSFNFKKRVQPLQLHFLFIFLSSSSHRHVMSSMKQKKLLVLTQFLFFLSAVPVHIFAFYINLFFSVRHKFFDFIRYSLLSLGVTSPQQRPYMVYKFTSVVVLLLVIRPVKTSSTQWQQQQLCHISHFARENVCPHLLSFSRLRE